MLNYLTQLVLNTHWLNYYCKLHCRMRECRLDAARVPIYMALLRTRFTRGNGDVEQCAHVLSYSLNVAP